MSRCEYTILIDYNLYKFNHMYCKYADKIFGNSNTNDNGNKNNTSLFVQTPILE